MNHFQKVLNFIFPKEELSKEGMLNILKNRVYFFSQKQSIIFLPYKNRHVRDAIWSLKFKNNTSAAGFFGDILYENLPEILEDLALSENFNDLLLINIPISFSKKISRGYNQNDLVIQSFINQGGGDFITWEKNILYKTKNTKPQSRIKNRNERLVNIKNSFDTKNHKKIEGRNIILFDDVVTTGATLNEAKKVLKKAGAKKIIYMALAH